jgi:hypothetical protein
MNGDPITLAAEIISLIEAGGTLALDLYLKLEQIAQLGPDEQANIAAQISTALAIDEDTKARIDDWKKQHGLT